MKVREIDLDAIRSRVCRGCIDSDGHGNCMISSAADCTITRFFPQIVSAVRSVSSPFMEPYEAELRKRVCSECVHQSRDGSCAVRNDVECALDRYFPLIVQAIEEIAAGEGNTLETVAS